MKIGRSRRILPCCQIWSFSSCKLKKKNTCLLKWPCKNFPQGHFYFSWYLFYSSCKVVNKLLLLSHLANIPGVSWYKSIVLLVMKWVYIFLRARAHCHKKSKRSLPGFWVFTEVSRELFVCLFVPFIKYYSCEKKKRFNGKIDNSFTL